MFEIEAKFPCPDPQAVRRQLLEQGFHIESIEEQTDHYFNAPDRDFSTTDEALRLRCAGSSSYLTYKGPKMGKVGKSRREIEVPLRCEPQEVPSLIELLRALGYRPTLTVRKRREAYRPAAGTAWPRDLAACVDEVEQLGTFLELERTGEAAAAEQIQTELHALARKLGLAAEERRSYLELLLERGDSAAGSGS